MVVPNMVMKFHNFDILYTFGYIFTYRLHSPAAWKVLKNSGIMLEQTTQKISKIVNILDFIVTAFGFSKRNSYIIETVNLLKLKLRGKSNGKCLCFGPKR